MSSKLWASAFAALFAIGAGAAPEDKSKEEDAVKLKEYQVGGPKRELDTARSAITIERPTMDSDMGFSKPDLTLAAPPAIPAAIPAVLPPGVKPRAAAPANKAPVPAALPPVAPRPTSTPAGPGSVPAVSTAGDPIPVKLDPPDYPREAALAGTEGYVVVEFTVNTAGDAVDIAVVESQPRNTFDSAARRAVARWKFQPPLEAKRIRRTITFTL